jgi:hypothetical protein
MTRLVAALPRCASVVKPQGGKHGRTNAVPEILGNGALMRRRMCRWPNSAFRLPHSAFRLPPSAFRLPHSAFRIPHSVQLLTPLDFKGGLEVKTLIATQNQAEAGRY